MWKRVCLSLFVISTALYAAPATKPVGHAEDRPASAPNKVVAVTVYQGTALVTREVQVKEGQGLMELIVSPLPAQTIDSSLYTEGTDGMRILTTWDPLESTCRHASLSIL